MITQRYQAVNICSELILHECSYYVQLHGSTHLDIFIVVRVVAMMMERENEYHLKV